mmetsp:Transcript_64789/g.94897  ORF Transcript_64789/g.94897 Transcript_64789/m.94897 type:complete len:89 (+) Transcript_64789:117-383(+)
MCMSVCGASVYVCVQMRCVYVYACACDFPCTSPTKMHLRCHGIFLPIRASCSQAPPFTPPTPLMIESIHLFDMQYNRPSIHVALWPIC